MSRHLRSSLVSLLIVLFGCLGIPLRSAGQCDHPLENITLDILTAPPGEGGLGMTGLEEDETLDPDWQTLSPRFNYYRFTDTFITGDRVGVVLPQVGYTVKGSPSGPDTAYDVNGCWGASGAYVIAGPGLYTFLALRPTNGGFEVLEAGALAVDAYSFAPPKKGHPPVFNRAPAANFNPAPAPPPPPTPASVFPLTPTDPNAPNGPTGGMISAPPDDTLKIGKTVMKNLQPNWTPFTDVKNVGDMVNNITNVFNANGMALIAAGEVGHGSPNSWTDGTSTFSAGPATPSLTKLEMALNGTAKQFDIFSCAVAQGNTAQCNANHVQTHLAKNSVDAAGDQVFVRAFDVVISVIKPDPNGKQKKGDFQLKNINPNTGTGDYVTVTCSGNPVTCDWALCPIYPTVQNCTVKKNTCK